MENYASNSWCLLISKFQIIWLYIDELLNFIQDKGVSLRSLKNLFKIKQNLIKSGDLSLNQITSSTIHVFRKNIRYGMIYNSALIFHINI